VCVVCSARGSRRGAGAGVWCSAGARSQARLSRPGAQAYATNAHARPRHAERSVVRPNVSRRTHHARSHTIWPLNRASMEHEGCRAARTATWRNGNWVSRQVQTKREDASQLHHQSPTPPMSLHGSKAWVARQHLQHLHPQGHAAAAAASFGFAAVLPCLTGTVCRK